jgi:hypothetical protein
MSMYSLYVLYAPAAHNTILILKILSPESVNLIHSFGLASAIWAMLPWDFLY